MTLYSILWFISCGLDSEALLNIMTNSSISLVLYSFLYLTWVPFYKNLISNLRNLFLFPINVCFINHSVIFGPFQILLLSVHA